MAQLTDAYTHNISFRLDFISRHDTELSMFDAVWTEVHLETKELDFRIDLLRAKLTDVIICACIYIIRGDMHH